MDDDADAKIISRLPHQRTGRTTRASSYYVAEHRPTRSESLQPHNERNSRPGSESPSVEALGTPSGACQKRRRLNILGDSSSPPPDLRPRLQLIVNCNLNSSGHFDVIVIVHEEQFMIKKCPQLTRWLMLCEVYTM